MVVEGWLDEHLSLESIVNDATGYPEWSLMYYGPDGPEPLGWAYGSLDEAEYFELCVRRLVRNAMEEKSHAAHPAGVS